MKPMRPVFKHFLEKFPEVELPVTINTDTHFDFSAQNDPLPTVLIDDYILDSPADSTEYDEFVPCFQIPDTHAFHAVVYWKAALLTYEYYLATYNKKGELLDKKIIGGTKVFGNLLLQSVTILEDDWTVMIVEGASLADIEGKEQYDASKSKIHKLELLPSGAIILLDEHQQV